MADSVRGVLLGSIDKINPVSKGQYLQCWTSHCRMVSQTYSQCHKVPIAVRNFNLACNFCALHKINELPVATIFPEVNKAATMISDHNKFFHDVKL